jgi:PhnB protein
MIIILSPYFMFNGNALDAMKFYHSIFGGELIMQTYGEAPIEINLAMKDKIMHASLTNEYFILMASDHIKDEMHKLREGNNISLTLTGSDEKLLTDYFNMLSEQGKIMMPLEKQFWGDIYGTVTDKFGIDWMINITKNMVE